MSIKRRLTANRIRDFKCPVGKPQAFLWDASTPHLALRVTPNGEPSFVFDGRFAGKSVRITIGKPPSWSIPKAQERARQIQQWIDCGRDPREVIAESIMSDQKARAVRLAEVVTFKEAWRDYIEKRMSIGAWSQNSYRDHLALSQLGGKARKRMPGIQTTPGPLAELMDLKLVEIRTELLEPWALREAKVRPARLRSSLRLLKAFLRWASSQPRYKPFVDPEAASAKLLWEIAGTPSKRDDVLQREQLQGWFREVVAIQNVYISAYLQCLLLTGVRREELASLEWQNVKFRWGTMLMRHKTTGTRTVTLTPYVAFLLTTLPRHNNFVFYSPQSESGYICNPSAQLSQVCVRLGVKLSLHGIRRSFATLAEWLEMPDGIARQIQGYAAQGVREKHYVRRPIDMLRMYHERFETWVLQEAKIEFDEKSKGLTAINER